MKQPENRPNKLWPVGCTATIVDAHGFNPVDGKVLKHYGETNILVEDSRGVVYFGATWRIVSDPPTAGDEMFDDLLGDLEMSADTNQSPVTHDFEDLLG